MSAARRHGGDEGEEAYQPMPGPGSLVMYHPVVGDPGPHPGPIGLPAIVAAQLTEQSFNLCVIAADGSTYGKQCVLFVRKGESALGNAYCDVAGYEGEAGAPALEEGRDLARQRARALANEADMAAARDRPVGVAGEPAPEAEAGKDAGEGERG